MAEGTSALADFPLSTRIRHTYENHGMSPITERELNRLRFDLESDRVERKRSAADRSKLSRNICAFANDLPSHCQAGVILVGVDDDGECSNLMIDDRLLQRLASMKDDGNISPCRPSSFRGVHCRVARSQRFSSRRR